MSNRHTMVSVVHAARRKAQSNKSLGETFLHDDGGRKWSEYISSEDAKIRAKEIEWRKGDG